MDSRDAHFLRWYRTLPILIMVIIGAVSLGIDAFVSVAPSQLARTFVYPVKYADTIEQACKEQGVDPYLACAVIKCESGWDANARSGAGAVGLMQLMPATSAEVARLGLVNRTTYDPNKLTDPIVNIEYGVAYLGYLQRTLGSRDEAVAAYNAGLGKVSGWQKGGGDISDNIQYAETASYLARVNDAYSRYQALYPKGIAAKY